jgi:hypothetical protein
MGKLRRDVTALMTDVRVWQAETGFYAAAVSSCSALGTGVTPEAAKQSLRRVLRRLVLRQQRGDRSPAVPKRS